MVIAAIKLKDTPWKKGNDKPRQQIKMQSHYFTNKGPYNKTFDFYSSNVWI